MATFEIEYNNKDDDNFGTPPPPRHLSFSPQTPRVKFRFVSFNINYVYVVTCVWCGGVLYVKNKHPIIEGEIRTFSERIKIN